MASELTKRVAVAIVGIPLALVIIYYGGLAFGILVAVISGAAAWELYRMAAAKQVRAFTWTGVALATTFALIATAVPSPELAAPRQWLVLMFALLVLCTASIWLRGVAGGPLNAVAVTLFGALLMGGTLSHAIYLRELHRTGMPATNWSGAAVVCFPLILTWISDTCAYFGGRAWGDRKLIPSVSPGKTVAGAVTGVIGTTFAGALYARFVLARLGMPLDLLDGAIGGALISVVAQTGDLAESLFKREAGVKDSGALLPGHGGVFDRFDSLLFAFPVAYWYLLFILH